MRRHVLALVAALGLLLTVGVGAAAGDTPTQGVEQSAGTSQSADSTASSTQIKPTNSNISVRIGSPGNSGDVTQSNSSAAAAAAGNAALTAQQATQQQGGGGGVQAASQDAGTHQSADADATSEQVHPTNSNISVRIGSPGNDGNVDQSNTSEALALAGNFAATEQAASQQQGGGKCCGGGSGVQAAEQSAGTKQSADADATSEQIHPTNDNTSVRIGSPGGGGSVSQSNQSAAAALAFNKAKTIQDVDQQQSGGCGCGDQVQAAGQWAYTDQYADSDATSKQKGAKNSNTPVRIGSYGDDGDVSQSNDSAAFSAAANLAATIQTVDQQQSGRGSCCKKPESKKSVPDGHGDCGCSSAGVQAAGQWAFTGQEANADATSEQYYPTNTNAPVRIKSWGGGGSVDQANSSFAKALAFNAALTYQAVHQQQ